MNILFFDVESTGLPRRDEHSGEIVQPHITQLGFILERFGVDVLTMDALIKPDNWHVYTGVDPKTGLEESGTGISRGASETTGITQDMCEEMGIPIADAVEMFIVAAENADLIVCHNTAFDTKVMMGEYQRLQPKNKTPEIVFAGCPSLCTMKTSTPICKIPKKGVVRPGGSNWKWPKLEEAMLFFFNETLENAHSAIVDITATRKLFHKLIEIGAFEKEVYRMERAGLISAELLEEFRQLGSAA